MIEILFNNERNERALSNPGNPYRFLKLYEKAKRGEEIVFVTLGGSITTGCNASCWENHYGALLEKWLKETFPQATVKFVNAGIGATGSLMGIHRLNRDVLCHEPDFVLVEFSVNDGLNGNTTEVYYDNLLYKILNYKTAPAVLCVGMTTDAGENAQESHIKVAKHYNVPYISYRDAVWPDVENGTLKWSTLANDGVHPIDAGHKLVADLVSDYLGKAMGKNIVDYKDIDCSEALTGFKYQNAAIYHAGQIEPESYGCFKIADELVNDVRGVWMAEENGEPLVFKFKNAHRVFLQFERTNRGNGGKATAQILDSTIEMDSDFSGGWGVYYNNVCVYNGDEEQDLVLTITPKLNEGKHFVLVGILVS